MLDLRHNLFEPGGMMFKKALARLRNQNGFTMIEALIIAALLGVMVTTFASYQYQRAKQAKAREAKTEMNQLQTNVKNSIGQSESLTHTEDQEYAPLPNSTATATPAPSSTPEPTSTPTCPDPSCTFDNDSGNCTISSICMNSGSGCPEGCVITGPIPTTTTAGTGTSSTTTGGTSTGATTSTTLTGGNPTSPSPSPSPTSTPCDELPGCGVTQPNGLTGACQCFGG